jgi:hypothetical protein
MNHFGGESNRRSHISTFFVTRHDPTKDVVQGARPRRVRLDFGFSLYHGFLIASL